MGRRLFLRRLATFTPRGALYGISTGFLVLSLTRGRITYVLLTRPPLGAEAPRSTCMC